MGFVMSSIVVLIVNFFHFPFSIFISISLSPVLIISQVVLNSHVPGS